MTDDAQDGDRSRWPAIYGPAEPGIACLGFVLLLTPTWSLPSPRWRWWARVAAAAPVVYLVALALTPEPLDSGAPAAPSASGCAG